MPRDGVVYLQDILEAVRRIRDYAKGLDRMAFGRDQRTVDAVLHNLEVIGEAAKNVPSTLREEMPGIEWRKVGAMRDLLAHAYFQVDLDIVWDVVQTKLEPLEAGIESFLRKS
jgi:uncharacterized protein with HEPN domain